MHFDFFSRDLQRMGIPFSNSSVQNHGLITDSCGKSNLKSSEAVQMETQSTSQISQGAPLSSGRVYQFLADQAWQNAETAQTSNNKTPGINIHISHSIQKKRKKWQVAQTVSLIVQLNFFQLSGLEISKNWDKIVVTGRTKKDIQIKYYNLKNCGFSNPILNQELKKKGIRACDLTNLKIPVPKNWDGRSISEEKILLRS